MKKISIIVFVIFAVGGLSWLAFGFLGIQALFVDNKVEEDLPESILNLVSQQNNEAAGSEETDSKQMLLGSGSFQQGDSTYTISGDAFLSRVEGQLNLTFTGFEVSNGPDLFVYAVKTNSTDNKTLKEVVGNGDFVSLGALKGNIGDQNYTLEQDFDPNEFQVISIWCQRFGRNFGSAHLDVKPSE